MITGLPAGPRAYNAHHLVHQDRTAWSFEVNLRPFGEKW
jgi:hypothetical protein